MPSGARLVSPAIGYVTKLGLDCSPSVMTGDPVSSKRRMVSRMASSCAAASALSLISPRAWPAIAASSAGERGMLPIGSVGIVISEA